MENTYSELLNAAKKELQSEYSAELLGKLQNQDFSAWDLLRGFKNADILQELLFPQWARTAFLFCIILFILALGKKIINRTWIVSTVQYILQCLSAIYIIFETQQIFQKISVYMRDVSAFWGILTPTLGSLTAAGGNITSATANTTFLTVYLSAVQLLLHSIVPSCFTFFSCMAILDAFYGESRFLTLSSGIKNILFSLFSVLLTIFFIWIHTKSIAAANTDTMSAKTLRLLISNAIPIVGNTIGESLRFVSAGLMNVKNAVGMAAVIFLLGMYLPVFLSLFSTGILLSFLQFLCNYFAITEGKGIFVHMKYAFDFVLAAYSAVFVVGIMNIGIFMQNIPTIISS